MNEYEEIYIKELLSYHFDDSKESIFCYFPTCNFSMVTSKDKYRSLTANTLFVPIRIEKTTDEKYPFAIYIQHFIGDCVLTPHKSCWIGKDNSIKMMKLTNKIANYKIGALYKIYTGNAYWPLIKTQNYTDFSDILDKDSPILNQEVTVCLLEYNPETKKAKVLTLNGITGWIHSMLLKSI